MRIALTRALAAGWVLCGWTLCHNLCATTFITIDVPGAQITEAISINNAGAIAGYFLDSGHNTHAFVRAPAGTYTTFDVPGAGNASAVSMNNGGAATGYYWDTEFCHGFVRSTTGKFARFDPPGAAQGTFPASINDTGMVAGYYSDGSPVKHGFMRAASGAIVLSTRRARVLCTARALTRPRSTTRERSRVITRARTVCITDMCAMRRGVS